MSWRISHRNQRIRNSSHYCLKTRKQERERECRDEFETAFIERKIKKLSFYGFR